MPRIISRYGWHIVTVGGRLYGKYRSYAEAKDILRELSRS